MKLFNTALLTPRNIFVIALIGVAVHVLASPIYKMIDNDTSTQAGNT